MSGARDIFWPAITDRRSARRAVGPAAVAALVLALLTAVLVLTSRGLPQNALTLPPSALVKSALFGAVAYGLYYRISRAAAVVGMVLVLYNVAWVSEARSPTWLFIVVELLFVAAVRATFTFQRIERRRGQGQHAT